MKKPPVTPIFPRNKGENLPIRNEDSKDHILKCGGYMSTINDTQPQFYTPQYTPTPIASQAPTTINCITIAQHIEECPICSRLYDTDKTLYILAIIGLLILCFLMVKHIVKL